MGGAYQFLPKEFGRLLMYLTLPVAASVIYGQPDTMNKIVAAYKFVDYPASDEAIQKGMSQRDFQEQIRAEAKRIKAELKRKQDAVETPAAPETPATPSAAAARPWWKIW